MFFGVYRVDRRRAQLQSAGALRPRPAQSQGAIIGVVTDTSGAVLPGVTVIATGPALQVPANRGCDE